MSVTVLSGESSLLLWLLSAVVYLMGLHVGLVAVRDVLRDDRGEIRPQDVGPLSPEDRLRLALTAGVAWGTALSMGFVLALASLPLPYAVGFHPAAGLLLWVGAVLLCCVLVQALLHWPFTPEHAIGGGVLGLLALALQAGWLAAVGFKPGLEWRVELLLVAGLVMGLGLALALSVALCDAARIGATRRRWRVVGTLIATGAVLAGQEVLMTGMKLVKQLGSVYQHQLSSSLLSLVGGAVVPLVFLITLLLLYFSRRSRNRRHHRDFTLTQIDAERPQTWPDKRSQRSRSAARGTAVRPSGRSLR
jgi:hypothetical protein